MAPMLVRMEEVSPRACFALRASQVVSTKTRFPAEIASSDEKDFLAEQ